MHVIPKKQYSGDFWLQLDPRPLTRLPPDNLFNDFVSILGDLDPHTSGWGWGDQSRFNTNRVTNHVTNHVRGHSARDPKPPPDTLILFKQGDLKGLPSGDWWGISDYSWLVVVGWSPVEENTSPDGICFEVRPLS